MDYELYCIWVKNILMLDLFQLLMLTDGLWLFLSDSHSDGTHSHPLQRHPHLLILLMREFALIDRRLCLSVLRWGTSSVLVVLCLPNPSTALMFELSPSTRLLLPASGSCLHRYSTHTHTSPNTYCVPINVLEVHFLSEIQCCSVFL